MASKRRLEVEIIGDADSLKKAFKVGGDSSDTFGDKMKQAGKIAVVGLGAGVIAAGVAVKGFVAAASESEVSSAKMQAQLKALGISFSENAGHIDKVIQKTSALSGLDDEDLQASFTNIVRVTGDVNQALKLNALAADIARARHIDVSKAGDLVAKMAGGNVNALKRYGVVLEKGATTQEALAAAQARFAGQAKAYGDTSAGAQDKFKVAVENLQEAIGAHLLPIITKVATAVADFVLGMQTGEGAGGQFVGILKDVAGAAGDVVHWLGEHKTLLTDLGIVVGIATTAFVAYRVALVVGTAATGVMAAAQGALNAVMALNPITLVIIALTGLVAGLVLAYKHSETFRTIVDAAFTVVKASATILWEVTKTVFGGIVDVIRTSWGVIKAVTETVWGAIHGYLAAEWAVIKAVTGAAWDAIRAVIVDPVRAAFDWIKGAVSDTRDWLGVHAEKLAKPFVDAFNVMASGVKKVLGFLNDIIDTVKSVIDWIGKIKIPSIKVPDLNPFGGAGGGNVGPGNIGLINDVQSIADLSLGWGLSGGRGPGQSFRPGDPGWHGQNRARDLSGAPAVMLAFAQMLARTMGPRLLELIHTPLGFGIKNGQVVGLGFWGAQVNQEHYNHVHVAMAQGGVVRARVGETGPEDVLLPVGARVVPNHASRGGAGGMSVNYYGPVSIGSHKAAEVLANQLAYRVTFG